MKPLVFPRPTGHNLIVELDIFYPLPDTWRKPVKKPPPPPPPPPEHHHHHEEIIESWQGHDNHPGEIWMPPAGWNDPSNVIPNINDLKGGKRRNWSPQDSQENSNNWNEGNLFNYRPAPVTQYENPFIKRQYQQTPKQQTYNSNNRQYYPQQGPIYSPNNYQSQRKYSMGKGRSLELLPENATTSTIQTTKHDEIDEHWEHHYHHRDRRDLYSLIEKATLG